MTKLVPILLLPFLFLLKSCVWTEDSALPSLPDASLLDFSERTDAANVAAEATMLLAARNFDGLEKAAAKDEAAESPVADGSALITSFMCGVVQLDNGPSSDELYQRHIDLLKDWIKAHPDSPFPKVALAELFTDYAWFARGNGYANTVTDQGWQLFADRVQQARDQLDDAAPHRAECRTWYATMALVGVAQSWKHDDFFKIVDEGNLANPNFMELHEKAIMYLLPRWFGSDQELRDYITRSADNIGDDDGDILYARLARGVWAYAHDTNVFTEVGLSWPRIEHGFTLILNRYPHSANMMNYFCLFAYQSQDQSVAHYLFDHLGLQCDQSVWGGNIAFDDARSWAGIKVSY
jgi:hypothetical protein